MDVFLAGFRVVSFRSYIPIALDRTIPDVVWVMANIWRLIIVTRMTERDEIHYLRTSLEQFFEQLFLSASEMLMKRRRANAECLRDVLCGRLAWPAEVAASIRGLEHFVLSVSKRIK